MLRRPQPPRAEASIPKPYFTGPELSSAPVSVCYKRRWGHAGAEDLKHICRSNPLKHLNRKFAQSSPPSAPKDYHRAACGYQAAPRKLASVSPLEGIGKRCSKTFLRTQNRPAEKWPAFPPFKEGKIGPRRTPRQGKRYEGGGG